MAAKPTNHPSWAMELSPQYENRGGWVPPMMRVQTAIEAGDEVASTPEKTKARHPSNGMDLETTDAVVYRMDRLVQDLLASQKALEREKREASGKDIEISLMKEEMARVLYRAREERQKREAAEAEVRELGRLNELNSISCEEANELRQLLAFHKTNGEKLSRELRDLQAICQDLEAQLQVTEMTLMEQMSFVSGLDISKHGGNSDDSKD